MSYIECIQCKKLKSDTKEHFYNSSKSRRCRQCILSKEANNDESIKQKCSSCNKEYPATKEYFYPAKTGKYGLKGKCKKCFLVDHKHIDIPSNEDKTIFRTCSSCKEEKPATNAFYHKDKRKSLGITYECKDCRTEGKINKVIEGKKKCALCNEIKPVTEFHKTKKSYKSKCKNCRAAEAKEHRKQHPVTKEKRGRIRDYARRKRKEDPSFRIRQNLSRRINYFIKKKKDSQFTMNLLGCLMIEYRDYLELKFEPGMSWDNYGNPNGDHTECWHIDHIKPCSSFDLTDEEQQKECFHYTNTQPLWAKDNLIKQNKY